VLLVANVIRVAGRVALDGGMVQLQWCVVTTAVLVSAVYILTFQANIPQDVTETTDTLQTEDQLKYCQYELQYKIKQIADCVCVMLARTAYSKICT
jgi:hypothetical protein